MSIWHVPRDLGTLLHYRLHAFYGFPGNPLEPRNERYRRYTPSPTPIYTVFGCTPSCTPRRKRENMWMFRGTQTEIYAVWLCLCVYNGKAAGYAHRQSPMSSVSHISVCLLYLLYLLYLSYLGLMKFPGKP